MANHPHQSLPLAKIIICFWVLFGVSLFCVAQAEAQLPPSVKAVWDLDKAWRQTTPTRERICVNGLWRWQPAQAGGEHVPTDGWGYFKVPGCWPGIQDYMQKDSQTVFENPAWKGKKLGEINAAWYQREIEVPRDWTDRRIELTTDYLNSLAIVFVDGKRAGEMQFPAGELDLSSVVAPGTKHLLSLYVVALPLKGVMLSYTDSAAAREVKGSVPRRGLCGDVYLVSTPAGARIEDVQIDPSMRRGEIGFSTAVSGVAGDRPFTVRARISDKGKQIAEFTSPSFKTGDLEDGRIKFTAKWNPDKRWDLNTPQNQYTAELSLLDATGKAIDTAFDTQFGYRELWIDGKDFILNGSRIFLSAVPFDNASIGAGSANYSAARETLERLKRIGINFVYTHNYDCEPGSHVSLEEFLRAADDVGMLVAITQPHFSTYEWKAADADANNGYARHAAFYVRIAQNHPSVCFYSTSHNATGYDGDMDPDQIDGIHAPRETWSANNVKLALRAEAIIHSLDPSRIVYHHAGGNIGSMHSINFYPNMAPIQELSDWFGHWSSVGVKPAFMCEYGAPFTWDWTMYRGWYKGKREFGSAAVPWEFCMAEWNAQFLGDRAYQSSDQEKANLRWEAKQFRAGETWHRWDYPAEVGSPRFADRHTVLGMYTADNWRAYRTWGVSGISPWEYGHFWSPRDGVKRGRVELPVDWEKLQRPGFSPDYIDDRVMRMDTAFEYADWIPTADGKALLANNQPVLAYIGGKADAFTEKGHNFLAGQTIEKQAILINNSRQPMTFHYQMELNFGSSANWPVHEMTVQTGSQVRVPLTFHLPKPIFAQAYDLRLITKFGDAQEQSDTFTIHVLPAPPELKVTAHVALFDPQGQTDAMLKQLGVAFQSVKADADLSAFDELIVGKFALTVDGPAPDISRIRDGLKVIVFEQSRDVLEKRLGFRAEEYGLRQVFERIPNHPILAGLDNENLRDWRGEATTISSKLAFDLVPMHGPTVKWCDIPVSRVWRCGTRGSVASVLIEKPARGDFRPIIDGGFSLQFSPLMEYRQGKGIMLFCQLDVTGRTENDPAAQRLIANLLNYVSTWKPDPTRTAIYVGEPAGKKHLESIGVKPSEYGGGDIAADEVLILGPGASGASGLKAVTVQKFLAAGGRLLAISLDQKEADALLPFKVNFTKAEHISTFFDPPGLRSPLAGVSPADVHLREPRELSLVTGGATVVGDGVLAYTLGDADQPSVIFDQLAPWQLDYKNLPNVKRDFRRSSSLLTRLLGNLGVAGDTSLTEHFSAPVKTGQSEKRWLDGLYLDPPEEWDDPYRFFRW